MRKTLRVCFLVLALVLTVFGWNQSRAGVCLVWALLCVEELVSLQMQQNAKPVSWYGWYKAAADGRGRGVYSCSDLAGPLRSRGLRVSCACGSESGYRKKRTACHSCRGAAVRCICFHDASGLCISTG